jgi:hypothetical protein
VLFEQEGGRSLAKRIGSTPKRLHALSKGTRRPSHDELFTLENELAIPCRAWLVVPQAGEYRELPPML